MGKKIIEYSFLTGLETEIEKFPSPDEMCSRLRVSEGIRDDLVAERLLASCFVFSLAGIPLIN